MTNSTKLLQTLSPKQALAAALIEKDRRLKERKILTFYPDAGPLRRALYPKHMEFFSKGAAHRQRLFLAANRVGKTEGAGLYEVTMHATGWYPEWWTGKKYAKPPRIWAAGDTGKTVREILQLKLLGPVGNFGTGLVPGECIEKLTRGGGVADSIEIIYVKHKSGGTSSITLKSYDQRVEAFQGTEIDFILLDEEPPMDIYIECLMRTMTNAGLIALTFTPLLGMSEVVLKFLPGGKLTEGEQEGSKYVIMATWDDVPHLSKEVKEELWAEIPPFQRDARSKGVPQLGSGAIFPIAEEDIRVKDFKIPEEWPRAFGMDVGWKATAALWGAMDRQTDTLYIYAEYKRGLAEPVSHAYSVRAKGDWIHGVIDPASRGRNQKDGTRLLEEYKQLGLKLDTAVNAREAGLLAVWKRLQTGRLKIFMSCHGFFEEYRLYRRDKDGQVVKENDHIMDCLRYLVMSGLRRLTLKPEGHAAAKRIIDHGQYSDNGWMQ